MYHDKVGSPAFADQLGLNSIADRTQLFPFSVIPFLKLFGDSFFVYEMVGLSMMIFLIPALFLLARLLFKSKKVAYLSVLFFSLNYYLFYLSILTQMKYISLLFLIMFIYYLIKYRTKSNSQFDLILAGLMGGAAVLFHNYAIIYIIAGLFYLSPNPLNWFKDRIQIFKGILLPVVIFIVWLVGAKIFSNAWLINDVTVGAKQSGLWGQISSGVESRYLNVMALFNLGPTFNYLNSSIGFFKLSIIGFSTISLFFPIIFGVIRRYFIFKAEIISFIIVVFVLDVLFNGIYTFYGIHLYLIGCLPFLFPFAAAWVCKAKKAVRNSIILLAIVEFAYVSLIYYPLDITAGIRSSISNSPIAGWFLLMAFLAVFIILVVYLLLNIFVSKKNREKENYKFFRK
ncbi:MAG: glycosyltransferase family 39 protein [Candidatus Berkelbacteria bacterium]